MCDEAVLPLVPGARACVVERNSTRTGSMHRVVVPAARSWVASRVTTITCRMVGGPYIQVEGADPLICFYGQCTGLISMSAKSEIFSCLSLSMSMIFDESVMMVDGSGCHELKMTGSDIMLQIVSADLCALGPVKGGETSGPWSCDKL
jgi:hypothetical protein